MSELWRAQDRQGICDLRPEQQPAVSTAARAPLARPGSHEQSRHALSMADFSYTVADGGSIRELDTTGLSRERCEQIVTNAERNGVVMLDFVQREVRAVHRLATGVQIELEP